MRKSLRNRLILSHILPLAIVIPLLGIAMVFLLERLVYLPSLSNELLDSARFLAEVVGSQPEQWLISDQTMNHVFQSGSTANGANVILLNLRGAVVAANDPQEFSKSLPLIDNTGFLSALNGQEVRRVQFHWALRDAEIIDVFVPVFAPDKQVIGVVRMNYRYASLADDFFQLRFLIAVVVLFGIVIGSGLGYVLAVSLEAPIKEVTQAVEELTSGSRSQLIRESGPDEIRQLARAVNQLVSRLRELEATRKQLLANLIHEIGRPLGALRSAIQSLSFGAEQDPQIYQELISGMGAETERLQHLLEDLGHLHEQLLGTVELHRQAIHVDKWLPATLITWQEAANQHDLDWRLEIEQDLPVIAVDANRLAQIVGNLVGNAIQYTPPGGWIMVSAKTRDNFVGIGVEDSGPGILPEEQERVFTPFFRGSHGTRFPQGMGLGLSIVRDLVDAHGGKIELTSTPGEGSLFSVWLPVSRKV